MKPLALSFVALTSMVMASLHPSISSHTKLARSLLSSDIDDLQDETLNIWRRSGQPPSSSKATRTSSSILRGQDAGAASDRRNAETATQGATNPLPAPVRSSSANSPFDSPGGPHSTGRRAASMPSRPPTNPAQGTSYNPPSSPPASPRTAGRRADEAEAAAGRVRTEFNEMSRANIQRHTAMFKAAAAHTNPTETADNRYAFGEWETLAARKKREQEAAYRNAASASLKAGREDRYTRNLQKAAGSKAWAESLDASAHLSTTLAGHQLGQIDPVDPWQQRQSRTQVTEAKNRLFRARQEVKRLRESGDGADTDSSEGG